MNRYFIAICGGSGSGKSTLAYGLQDKYPDLIEVLHFDDYHRNYHKELEKVPITKCMRNWDHPDSINFDSLIKDIKKLKEGENVEIMTKSERHNPDYEKKGRIRIPLIIRPKKIIIIEGFMVLWDKRVREFLEYSIFLNLTFTKSLKRRNKIIDSDETEYNKKILIPMQKKYVESTKKYADLIIDIEKVGKDEMLEIAINKLKEAKIL